jgi:hypothetical protein
MSAYYVVAPCHLSRAPLEESSKFTYSLPRGRRKLAGAHSPPSVRTPGNERSALPMLLFSFSGTNPRGCGGCPRFRDFLYHFIVSVNKKTEDIDRFEIVSYGGVGQIFKRFRQDLSELRTYHPILEGSHERRVNSRSWESVSEVFVPPASCSLLPPMRHDDPLSFQDHIARRSGWHRNGRHLNQGNNVLMDQEPNKEQGQPENLKPKQGPMPSSSESD